MIQHRNVGLVLFIIVLAQFTGTSLWFAGNAILPDLSSIYGLDDRFIGHITSAVQIGFITGTLTFAFLTISDRFASSWVFFVCAVLGASFNSIIVLFPENPELLLVFRFLTGFFLAGIYPVGMKIAADWHEKGLGKALGFLVGALVLGTAFPHLIQGLGADLPWKYVLLITSLLAVLGGLLLLLFVPEGPFARQSTKPDYKAFFDVFKKARFRSAAFGYFGHMWELYTFWAFVPFILAYYAELNSSMNYSVPLLSFVIISMGSLGCAVGGFISLKRGSHNVAFVALLISGICCMFSPVIYLVSLPLFVLILLIWGFTVVADSPQFSTLVAQTAPSNKKGTALTIVNSVGFAITIPSIQLVNYMSDILSIKYVMLLLAIGPLFGLVSLRRQFK